MNKALPLPTPRRVSLILGLGGAAAISGVGVDPVAAAPRLPLGVPEEVGLLPDGLARVDAAVQKFIDDKELAGAVTIVARRGKVAHFKAYGMRDLAGGKPMEEDTIFRIYSMTKPIVSVAAMMLVEEGKLELDAPLSRYVPEAKGMKVGKEDAGREMTVRDLLRHSSGLPNNVTVDRIYRNAGLPPLSESTLEQMTEQLAHVPLRYEPGTNWYYSFAADVVARLVEIGSGQPVDEFLAEHIFRPLGMVDTAFHVPAEKRDRFARVYGRDLREVDAPQPGTSGRFTFEEPPVFLSGGGGLVSTATDYMRFCLMLSGMGELEGTRLLKAETVAEMTRNQLPEHVLPISRPPTGRGFGLGFAVRVEKIDSEPSSLGEYEWLGGAGTEFWISPRDELVVITLSQSMPMRQLGQAVKPLVYGAIAPERHLLLDARVVARTENARLTLGTVVKHEDNPLFVEDKRWEPRFDNLYPNVIYDEEDELYKCWYGGFLVDERTTSTPVENRNPTDRPDYMGLKPNRREEGVCYAVSKDGIRWEKPELGLVEFGGNTRNNILVRGPSGAGVFKDRRDSDPGRRYKMFFSGADNNIQRVAFSADGLRWGQPILCPEIEAGGDTHNSAVWSPVRQKYVGIMRLWDGQRIVGRTESADFVKWSKAKTILKGVPSRQTHEMVVARTSGIYIGLVGAMDYPVKGSNAQVTQHVELAWSPDSVSWHRIQPGTPFIPRAGAKTGQYGTMPFDWGCLFPSAPISRDDEIRIYYGASDWYFFDWRKGCLALATLRPDGWAGYEQIEEGEPAFLTTTPIACTGDKLRLTADVAAGGSIGVTLLDDEDGELSVGEPMRKTVTDAGVEWRGGFPLAGLRGRLVKLRVELRGAKLFSFSFAD